MSTVTEPRESRAVDRDEKLLAGLVYGLYLIGNIIGVTSIIGLIIAYVRRDGAPHWLRTHYNYQIRSFWYALIGLIVCSVLVVTVILSPFGLLGYVLIWLWMLIRGVVGLMRLIDGREQADPEGFGI